MFLFFLKDPAPTEIYTLSLHDALPIFLAPDLGQVGNGLGRRRPEAGRRRPALLLLEAGDELAQIDRKSTRPNSSHVSISYAVFCLKKKNSPNTTQVTNRYRSRSSIRSP